MKYINNIKISKYIILIFQGIGNLLRNGMNNTVYPSGPTIEPSEPEKEIQFIEKIIEAIPNPEVPKIISIQSTHDYITSAGLDVDENGFIVDKETCEYVEPYAFSKDAFMESVDVAENPFDEYFVPLSETPVVKNTERTHLTDLHTINKFNGEVHPVKDDMFNISKMARNIGITYSVVTAWSDCIHFVESEDDTIPIYWEKESDVDMNLNCFGADCDYSGGVSNWIKDNSDELICPQCEVLWDTKGIAICNECNCTHQSEDIHMDSYSSDMYCPDCNKTIDYESIKNRYDIM